MTSSPAYRRLHTGQAYTRAREEMLLLYGHVCWLCGHDIHGSPEADYIIPVQVDPYQDPGDPHNKRPSHGPKGRCFECEPIKGKCCNQSRNKKAISKPSNLSEDW